MSQSGQSTLSNQSRIWHYFTRCDDDPNKARCNLCSLEVCNRGTTTILWNHVKSKHSIDRASKTTIDDGYHHNKTKDRVATELMTLTRVKNPSSNDTGKNLDFIDYNDLTITSMKPLPSSSLSKNLISRLNQLSSPVTRKLKFWNKKSFQVNQYDPSFKVIYLGNLGMQLWSKDESCLEKPLNTLWNNYLVNMKTEIVMRLTICNSGLKAITRQHGLTQYWSNRLVYCCCHKSYPRIFSWVYRHEGKKMRQELRCHAVFCPSPEKAEKMVTMLNQRLACALQEFRREKKSRGVSIATDLTAAQQRLPRTIPLRRQILAKGSANFRPPLERSKSAPKLTSIQEEEYDLDELEASQDEYEYEEMFGDKNDDIDEKDDFIGEDFGQKTEESNSLATTANEETSNSSSVYATGDITTNDRRHHRLSDDDNDDDKTVNGQSSVESNMVRRFTACQPSSNDSSETDDEINKYSSSEVEKDSHKLRLQNQEMQQSSANIKTSSSSQMVKREDINLSLMITSEAKNSRTSNNKDLLEPPATNQVDDETTRDILVSWSNHLVIN